MDKNAFINRASKMHNNKFDYSRVKYVDANTPVCIVCPEHGEFWMAPREHVYGHSCPKCAEIAKQKWSRMSQEEFIKRCREVHGDKYDYSKTVYNGMNKKITIICPKHGEFTMEAVRHVLSHQGCPKCAGRNLTQDDIINMFREKHGDKYDYSKVVYTRMHDKVTIICPKHGEFEQTPSKHLKGQGCPKCAAIERGAKRAITKDLFIERCNKIHQNKYDYSLVDIHKCHDKVKIICPIHGEFEQLAYDHLHGHGCPKCAQDVNRMTQEEFIKRAREIHGDKYDYSKVHYINTYTTVEIICPIHGSFFQTPDSHINKKCGCPTCGKAVSKAENELYEYVCSLVGEENVEQRNRKMLNGKEIDIYIPSLKLGIEYNGVLWHSTRYKSDKDYHLKKMQECNNLGITLIQIFEDEYYKDQNAVLNKLKELIAIKTNVNEGCLFWHAKEIDEGVARELVGKYSLTTFNEGVHNIGIYNDENGELCCMLQCNPYGYIENLINLVGHDIVMGYDIALQYIAEHYNIHKFTAITDLRWLGNIEKNIYTKLGFKNTCLTNPEEWNVNVCTLERLIFPIPQEHTVQIWGCGYGEYQKTV